MQIAAFTDEIITLLPLYSIWRSIFSHTVCVIFIGVVVAGGGDADDSGVIVANANELTRRKPFANSQ